MGRGHYPTARSLLSITLAVAALALCILPAHTAQATSALEELREAVDGALAVAQDLGLGEEERLARLRQVVSPRMDFDLMARSVLGRHRPPSDIQATEFRELFVRLLEERYVRRVWFAEAAGSARVMYLRERTEGAYATVETLFVTARGARIPVTYRLHALGGRWKVYDVEVEGVSLIENYRVQIERIMLQSSFEQLVALLRAMLNQTEAHR